MDKEYPKLMKSRISGCIVKFTKKEVGKIVIKGECSFYEGYFSENWNMDVFERYHPLTRRKLNTGIN